MSDNADNQTIENSKQSSQHSNVDAFNADVPFLTGKKEPLLVSGNVMITGGMHPGNLVQR